MTEHADDAHGAGNPHDVPVRPAATVMLVRDPPGGDAGVDVLMLRRHADAAFAAGMYVFPGGRVDTTDAVGEIAAFCRGLDDARASDQLGIARGGLAYWVAAVRECFEEAGVLLAARRGGGALALRPDDRRRVHGNTLSLVDLCRRDDLILDMSNTHYVAHWITPVGAARRFDTRFFLTAMPPDQEPQHDATETVDSVWVRPADALERQAAGELAMMPPTIANLRFLAGHANAAASIAASAAITRPPCIEPRLPDDLAR